MKLFKLLIIGLIILTSCTEKKEKQNESIFNEGPVIVAGQLENAIQKRIELIILEPTGRVEYFTKTDDNGCFQFNVEVLSAHENYFHAGQLTTIYLEPNDSIFITGDANKIDETISFSGNNAKINTSLNAFNNELGKRLKAEEYFYKYTKNAKTAVTPTEYKNIIFSFFDNMDLTVDSIAKKQEAEQKAIDWMKAYLKYRQAEEIIEYIENYEGELPTGFAYFDNADFLKRRDADLNCSQYYEDFLQSYYLQYKLSKVEGFGEMMKGYRDMTFDGVNNALNFINENVSDQLYKNLFLTVLCNSLIEADCQLVDSVFTNYAQIVDDITCQNFIKRRIINKMAEPLKVNTIDELANKKFIGETFTEIKNKCKGKVIYFDIWGTWCGGCVNALPHTNKLYHELKNEDIQFVYICLMSKENDWERIIKKYELQGLHYLFEKDEYEEMGDLLNTYGIPRYVIVDKNGNIVDDNAKSPHSRVLKNELLTLIEK